MIDSTSDQKDIPWLYFISSTSLVMSITALLDPCASYSPGVRSQKYSYKLCLGRTWISITMKFRNEVVNGGVTIILFVVTNLVCVLKKRNLSIFRGLKGAWKHIRTLEWKWKRDGTPVPSESQVNPISDRVRKEDPAVSVPVWLIILSDQLLIIAL
ncbi:hypothetical protein CASFOL_007701 [Castilleja foliolosa]|uniref:NAD(P)H-quinone oxidoreductase subunit 2 N-terminal domain-containing protein n=1 Tax=Castilleja foliolosa TaxID=1961234 RepID=A0ABD3E3D5_9LAMI